jgi:hypothetical protein
MKRSNDNDIPAGARYLVRGFDKWGNKIVGLYSEEEARYLATDRLNTIVDRVTGRMVNLEHLTYTPKR